LEAMKVVAMVPDLADYLELSSDHDLAHLINSRLVSMMAVHLESDWEAWTDWMRESSLVSRMAVLMVA